MNPEFCELCPPLPEFGESVQQQDRFPICRPSQDDMQADLVIDLQVGMFVSRHWLPYKCLPQRRQAQPPG